MASLVYSLELGRCQRAVSFSAYVAAVVVLYDLAKCGALIAVIGIYLELDLCTFFRACGRERERIPLVVRIVRVGIFYFYPVQNAL